MSYTRFIAAVSLFLLGWAAPLSALGADPLESTAEVLLRKAADASGWMRSAHVKLEFQATRLKPIDAQAARPPGNKGWGEIWQSGPYLHVIKQNVEEDDSEGARVEILRTPQRRICWQKGTIVQYTESPAVMKKSESLDYGFHELGWFLNGVFPNQVHPLFRLSNAGELGRVQPTVGEEQLGDLACHVVDITGDSWSLRLWIAPQRDYNLAKLSFNCQANPKLRYKEQRIVIDDIGYRQMESGAWVVESGTFRYHTLDHAPDRERQIEIHVRRTTIELNPDFEKLNAFALPPIPNGEKVHRTEVDAQGKEVDVYAGIKHIWKDGAIVPAYDPEFIQRVEKLIKQNRQDRK